MTIDKKVLIIRLSALGDVAMTAPLIHSLVRNYPDTQFTIVTRDKFRAIFDPMVGLEVMALPIDRKYKKSRQLPALIREIDVSRFDTIIDLHDVLRSNAIASYAALYGVKTFKIDKHRKERKQIIARKRPLNQHLSSMVDVYQQAMIDASYPITEWSHDSYIYSIHQNELLPDNLGLYRVGLAPFARYAEKSLPMEKIIYLVEQLNREQIKPILFGGGDTEYRKAEELVLKVNAINLINQNTLAEDLSAMGKLDLMISMDSANMHLARLVGTTTISVWGATHPALGFGGWGMTSDDYFQLNDDQLDCRPCSVFGNKTCSRKDLACLNQLDMDLLVQKIVSRLKLIYE